MESKETIQLEIIAKVSFALGQEHGAKGVIKLEEEDFSNLPDAYQAYLKGCKEGKKIRLTNLLNK